MGGTSWREGGSWRGGVHYSEWMDSLSECALVPVGVGAPVRQPRKAQATGAVTRV